MKELTLLLVLLFTGVACNQQSRSEASTDDQEGDLSVESTKVNLPDTVGAVCIWNNISVRDSPSGKGDWLTSISLGEQIQSTQIIKIDTANDNRKYVAVILADGSAGWALADFIISEAQPAVLIEESSIFERPDLLTKTDDSFAQMDIVAVKEKKDGWILVEGKRNGAKWISEGWIKPEKITQNELDIAFAKFTYEAFEKNGTEAKKKAIDDILQTEEFFNSIFYATLEQKYNELFPIADE